MRSIKRHTRIDLLMLASTIPLRTLCLISMAFFAAPGDEQLEEACDSLADRYQLAGVVLLTSGDEVLVERAYGLADIQRNEPVKADTRFLVASLTKPVVAFLTLRLVEAEKIRLDDVVSTHIAELQDAAVGRITVHQLLTHTSGLPHYEGWPGFLDDVTVERSDAELLTLLKQTDLIAEPGEEFHYSGPGYLLLGKVLERATHESLENLLDFWVFQPLKMTHSSLLTAQEDAELCAKLYERGSNGVEPAPLRHPSTLGATGGLITTAGDMHRFARAIQQSTLLTDDSHAILLEPACGQYACGFIVYRNPWTGERFARHKGNMGGVSAHFVFGLDDERVAITLSNVGQTRVEAINDGLIMKAPGHRAEEPIDSQAVSNTALLAVPLCPRTRQPRVECL